MSYWDRIVACNNADMGRYLPLYGRGARLGWIREDRTHALSGFPDVFVVGGRRVDLHGALFDFETATEAVDRVADALRADGVISGWRGERYAVAERFGSPALLTVERAMGRLLGIKSWGFHLNAFVRRSDGLHLWIAERAHDKATYPGLLDNTVAGGQPHGLSLRENVLKECEEEASFPPPLASQAQAVGALGYRHDEEGGLQPGEMFCFDLEVAEDIVPVPNDGEVHAFHLMPVADVMALVRDTEQFKFNCNLVLIHFFIRHGLLSPDDEPNYTALCAGLMQGETLPAGSTLP